MHAPYGARIGASRAHATYTSLRWRDGGRVLRSRQDRDRHELGHGARRSLLSRGPDLEAHDRARDLRADRLSAARRRRREDGAHARGDARSHQGVGPERACSEIVRETLDEVLTPIIYAEALELIETHKATGRKTVIISSSPIETVEPLGEHLGVDDVIATRARARRRRPVHGRARVLRVRSAQGRRDPRDGGAGGHRPRAARTPTPTRSPTCRCSSWSAIRSP